MTSWPMSTLQPCGWVGFLGFGWGRRIRHVDVCRCRCREKKSRRKGEKSFDDRPHEGARSIPHPRPHPTSSPQSPRPTGKEQRPNPYRQPAEARRARPEPSLPRPHNLEELVHNGRLSHLALGRAEPIHRHCHRAQHSIPEKPLIPFLSASYLSTPLPLWWTRNKQSPLFDIIPFLPLLLLLPSPLPPPPLFLEQALLEQTRIINRVAPREALLALLSIRLHPSLNLVCTSLAPSASPSPPCPPPASVTRRTEPSMP